jgi:pilus assembly protein CpaB
MRSSRTLIMIGLALLAGLAAAVLAVRWLNDQASARSSSDAESKFVQVAVASEDLRLGYPLTVKQVKMASWPAEAVPQGGIAKAEDAVGRVPLANMVKGEPILETKLAAKGARGGLIASIKPGKRAISVGVNEVVGVSGDALEGSFVDVLVNTSDSVDGDRQRNISKIVLQRVRVLAVSTTGAVNGRVNAVTLEVSPDDAEKLDLARSIGTLSLVLRSQAEDMAAATRGATREGLLGLPPRAPAAAAATAALPKPAPAPVREGGRAEASATLRAEPKTCVDALIGSERRSECF